MEWFEALILGLLQGLTEYLPVSSSGHLAIGSALFGIQGEDNVKAFFYRQRCGVASGTPVVWLCYGKGNRLDIPWLVQV